ncbi:MAG: beta-ketoacyl synthase N-terminal-like domain-containing protein [Phycisphaerales bacterium]
MKRRVVITGLGVLSAYGVGAGPLWAGLLSGVSALRKPTRFDPAGLPSQLWGEIPAFSAKDYLPKSYRKAVKVMARDIEIAVAAAKLAVDDARLVTRATEGEEPPVPTYPTSRVGCQIGAGLINAETAELASAMVTSRRSGADAELLDKTGGWDTRAWGTIDPGDGSQMSGMGNLQPLWMLKYLPNMLACHVTIIHGAEGPSNTHTCNEASGLLSLGEAARVIERHAADCCFAGSAESKASVAGGVRLALAERLALASESDDPRRVCVPFDPKSRGPLVGEGGGILVLEAAESAAARGARVYARVLGFGAAQSLGEVIPPLHGPLGGEINEGLEDAIVAALADAGIDHSRIGAVVSQANGHPRFDSGEKAALDRVFAGRSVPVVALAPFIGDCVAGNGGLQAAVGAMILANGRVPAVAAGAAGEQSKVEYVLVCSSSQGGQNAALVLGAA